MTGEKTPREVDIFEIYRNDPEEAGRQIFGPVANADRRGFLRGAGLTAMSAALGASIPFAANMPAGFIPAALAQEPFRLKGKDGLTVLNDRPVNAETPPHLLDDEVTPTKRHFIRNNGIPPQNTDARTWKLTVDGEVNKTLALTIDELKKNFEVVTHRLLIECGGNGRAGFNPGASGNQWTYGAVACSEWTGVRLADVLKAAGLKDSAVYTGHYGADAHLSGDPSKVPISRGVPIEKAMDPYNLIAFQMNGGAIHPQNGAPLRLVIPGWPGSCSQKWLTRIQVRDKKHDGPKMEAPSYSVPAYPVQPGAEVPQADFETILAMPVKSLITFPETGVQISAKKPETEVRGHAWAGDTRVTEVHLSKDFGATWQKAELSAPANPHAWQRFRAKVTFPEKGYYEIWARATDANGVQQPFAIAWNPKGYLNNSMHRIAVRVAQFR
jgi:DMSO/TMAO reductase YedYZ molybdopterin-dependent catalytic subunit